MKYRIVLIKRIASCFASFSSSDAILYKEVLSTHNIIDAQEIVVDKVAKVKSLWLAPDETFCKRGLEDIRQRKGFTHYDKHPDFIALVQKYRDEGWGDEPEWLKQANKALYAREDAAKEAKRKRQGFVLWKTDYKSVKPNEYQGGFSDEVFNSSYLKRYVDNGGIFGYIGHSCRKPKLDACIEQEFLKLKPKENLSRQEMVNLLGVWLTSTDGRYFGDSLENAETLVEQKKLVKSSMARIFNTAYIYSKPEHKGNWESTQELKEKYKDNLLEVNR